MGEDRALVRLGAQPHRLRHRVGAAGAAAGSRRTSARCRRWRTSTASRSSGATWCRCWRATPSGEGAARAGGASCWPLADTYETQLGDAAQAMLRLPARAGHRRALPRRHQRARTAVPAHAGLGPPGRRAGQEVAGRRRHRAGGQAAAAGRRAVGGPAGRQRARRRGLQRGPLGRPAEPAGAQGARHAVREDRQDGGVPREPRAPSWRSRRPRRIGSRLYSAWPTVWEEQLRQAGPRHRGAREDPAGRRPQPEGLPRPRAACTARSASGRRWSTPTASTSWSPTTRTSASSSTRKMGQVYEQELRDLGARHRGLQRRADRRARPRGGAGGAGPPVRGDRAVGSRRRDACAG